MTIPTVTVSVDLFQVVGTGLPNAKVRLTLTRSDILADGTGLVPVSSGIVQCDAEGRGAGPFFPNVLGTKSTNYSVEVFDENGNKVFPENGQSAVCTVPNQDCALHAILYSVPPVSVDDAQRAVDDSRANRDEAKAMSATPLFVFDASTVDGQPTGTGGFRLNHADPALATRIYFDDADKFAQPVAALLDFLDNSTSPTTKAVISLHEGATGKTLYYRVTGAVVATADYRKVPVVYLGGAGPLTAGNAVAMGYSLTGDLAPAGADQELIYSDGGAPVGSPDMLWNKTTKALSIAGTLALALGLTFGGHVLPSAPGAYDLGAVGSELRNGYFAGDGTFGGDLALPTGRVALHSGVANYIGPADESYLGAFQGAPFLNVATGKIGYLSIGNNSTLGWHAAGVDVTGVLTATGAITAGTGTGSSGTVRLMPNNANYASIYFVPTATQAGTYLDLRGANNALGGAIIASAGEMGFYGDAVRIVSRDTTAQRALFASSGVTLTGPLLAMHNGAVAQAVNVYHSRTDGASYKYATVHWSGQNLYIGMVRQGIAEPGEIHIAHNGGSHWKWDVNGNLLCSADSGANIGASGNFRPYNLHLVNGVQAAGLSTFGQLLVGGGQVALGLTNGSAAYGGSTGAGYMTLNRGDGYGWTLYSNAANTLTITSGSGSAQSILATWTDAGALALAGSLNVGGLVGSSTLSLSWDIAGAKIQSWASKPLHLNANGNNVFIGLASQATAISPAFLGVFSQNTDSNNYAYTGIWHTAGVSNIGTQQGGTPAITPNALHVGTTGNNYLGLVTNNVVRVRLNTTELRPESDNSLNLGTASYRFGDGRFAGAVYAASFSAVGAITAGGTVSCGILSTGTANISDLTLTGAAGVAAGIASSGIWFQGLGVRHGNLAYLPNEHRFEFHGGVAGRDTVDTYGGPHVSTAGTIRAGNTYNATTRGLPAVSDVGNGAQAYVIDATLAYTGANIGAAYVGGGVNHAPVRVVNGAWVIG